MSNSIDWLADDESQPAEHPKTGARPWKILIADDEPEVHAVTELALRKFRFDERPLEFVHAHSGAEAVDIMRHDREVAVILMDVVMEDEQAGLNAIDAIRSELRNSFVRIILRTGHPGQAPELDIISRYDIDNYKEKTELTAKKLFTAVYTALRSYRDLCALEHNRLGLEKVLNATHDLMRKQGIQEFAEGVLEQVVALMNTSDHAFIVRTDGFASTDVKSNELVAAIGRFRGAGDMQDVVSIGNGAAQRALEQITTPGTVYGEGWFIHCIESPSGRHMLLYLESNRPWTQLENRVLELFSHNVAVGMDNLFLNEQITTTQREIVLMLGEAIEMRSMEAGNHVQRVAEYSALLARLASLNTEDEKNLYLASPLHDVGKIAIDDDILNKPGRHTPEESERMREHASIGARLFEGHDLPMLRAAGIIAGQHHENWDGSGYPNGAKGEDIHIFGRIVALADVYDALLSSRCYKDAWPLEKTLEFIKEQRGRKFDPELVDLLVANIDKFVAIGEQLRDDSAALH